MCKEVKVIRKLILISSLFSLSMLKAETYTIAEKAGSEPLFFVKMGAFSDKNNALSEQKNIRFETHILHLNQYYSLVSRPFADPKLAKRFLHTIQKRYPDAYLMTLYRQREDQEQVIPQEIPQERSERRDDYEVGVSCYQNGDFEEALIHFDRVLIDNENNLDASLMYAKSLYRLKLYDDAERAFSQLLQKPLHADQKHLIEGYLTKIEAKHRRSFIDGIVSVGVGYDDNIELASKRDTTRYGGMLLQNDTHKKHSTFGIASLALSHRYRFDSFDWVSRFYSYNELAHTAKGNNLNYLDFSTGAAKQFDKLYFQLPVGANISYLDGDEIARNLYLSPKLGYSWSDNGYGYVGGSYLINKTKYAKNRDYKMRGLVCGVAQNFKKFQTGVAVGVDSYDPKESIRYDIDRDSLYAEGYLKYFVSRRFFVQSNLAYIDERYNDLDTNVGYKRKDRLKNVALKLGLSPSSSGWLSLCVARKMNDSNINAYSYDKNLYTMQYHYWLKDKK